jgi:hypothetical protein
MILAPGIFGVGPRMVSGIRREEDGRVIAYTPGVRAPLRKEEQDDPADAAVLVGCQRTRRRKLGSPNSQ